MFQLVSGDLGAFQGFAEGFTGVPGSFKGGPGGFKEFYRRSRSVQRDFRGVLWDEDVPKCSSGF